METINNHLRKNVWTKLGKYAEQISGSFNFDLSLSLHLICKGSIIINMHVDECIIYTHYIHEMMYDRMFVMYISNHLPVCEIISTSQSMCQKTISINFSNPGCVDHRSSFWPALTEAVTSGYVHGISLP